MYSFSFIVESVQHYCKRQSPKRAAYSSRVSSTASDIPMTLSFWQSQKNNFRLCWISSLTNAKSMSWRLTRRRPRRCTITVGNAVLEQVSKYSYLGHMITEDVFTLKDVQIGIEKTRQKFGENKELLRRNIGLNTKKRILACYVFSVFNYSCEAWTYPKTVQKKIQTFEMWCYRRLLKVPWTEKKNRNSTNGRCRRKTVATTYEAVTWVCWTLHEKLLGTFATRENRREDRTGKAKKELD
ncbi:endonuclease-reverse transcriptase [Elysia marginata]|uniref:Endonuclease-reverse transcriptase n=1 Tax=Elysia marginata TaxID=1093978 RepID=A0AAV4GKN4_9GAST|nr:endonuclease-reverse transcriptase [Elysia marginata]